MSEYKQVPVEPTEEMIAATADESRDWTDAEIYKAMVAAAPAKDHDKRVAELEAEIKRLTGFVVQRRKMCDDYDKALEEVASQMHSFKAELATEKARADAAVGDANEAEAELAEAMDILKGLSNWVGGNYRERILAILARHGDKS